MCPHILRLYGPDTRRRSNHNSWYLKKQVCFSQKKNLDVIKSRSANKKRIWRIRQAKKYGLKSKSDPVKGAFQKRVKHPVLWIRIGFYADPDSNTTNAIRIRIQGAKQMRFYADPMRIKHTYVGTKSFLKGWKSYLFPCSCIRLTNTDPDIN